MKVTIIEERIVLRYEVPNDEGNPSGSEFVLVHDDNITGDYIVLWKAHTNEELGENEYELMWKGNFAVCASRMIDEIEDFESTYINEGTGVKTS